jgi:2-oxoglutarate ferredoxin oxidoreductase subunit beta
MAVGIFRDVDKPTYNELLFGQIQQCVAQRGAGNLQKLLNAGTTWEVT